MIRIYAIAAVLISAGIAVWYHVQVARENAVLKISINSAEERIKNLEKDQKIKEEITAQAIQQKKEAQNETEKLKRDMAKLPRTQAQRDCDAVPTPDGYARRVLDYASLQGPINPTPSSMVGTDKNPPSD